jgi:hypothetical protein
MSLVVVHRDAGVSKCMLARNDLGPKERGESFDL